MSDIIEQPGQPVDNSAETDAVLADLIPVAKEIVAIISQNDYDLGKEEKIDLSKTQSLAQKVFDCIIKYDIRYTDRNILFQLVMQAMELHYKPALKLMEDQYHFAVEKLLGKEQIDLKMSDLGTILKS